MNEIKLYKNFLSLADQNVIEHTIFQPRWAFGHSSNGSTNGNCFWKIDGLEKEDFFSVYLLNKIKDLTGDDFNIERIYMNGHTAAGHGNIHTDSEFDNGRTFLIYCNKIWNPEFGGNTTFIYNDEITSFYPYPFSAIYFKNNVSHFAGPISRNFNGLRVTLAFKLFIK